MRTSSARRPRRLPLTVSALTTVAASAVLGLAGPAHAAGNVSYPHSVPSWATPARDAGKAADTKTVEGEIYLRLRDLQGATALAAAVSTPGSSQYHHWVTPQQWINRFSPPVSVYDGLVRYLKYAGFTITGTPDSRLFVVFRGTAQQINNLFGASLHNYSVDGKQLVAPSTVPTLPADIAASVSGMELDQGRLLTHPDSVSPDGVGDSAATPSAATASKTPTTAQCSTYYGQHQAKLPQAYGQRVFNTYICGYVPAQLRSAYGVSSPNSAVLAAGLSGGRLNGAGQTVAITDAYASPTILRDVNTYSARRGEPALTKFSQITPKKFYDQALCQEPSGWQTEETIDVEAVHGIAPAAGILYVGGFNCGGGLDMAISQILDHRMATIVSNSWGDVGEAVPADTIMGEENQHLQAAAEGIGLYFSSGDYGDEVAALGHPEPDYPASSPWVTSVGGTSTGIAKDGSVAVETGWGSHRDQVVGNHYQQPLPGDFRFGAGGGRSTIFPEPAYQQGVVPARLARGMRVSPDIAADADPYTGFLIGFRPIINDTTLQTDGYIEVTYGGTSLASPLVAAQMALVQQLIGGEIGFANPALYALHQAQPSVPRDVAGSAPFPLAFSSPTTGLTYLVTGNRDTSLVVKRGYDDVTGLGAIDFDFLRRAVN